MSFPEIIVSALIIGLAGSIHCVGMCGPIMLALPFDQDSWLNRFISNFIYFSGKALTYALMGLALGLMGSTVFPKEYPHENGSWRVLYIQRGRNNYHSVVCHVPSNPGHIMDRFNVNIDI